MAYTNNTIPGRTAAQIAVDEVGGSLYQRIKLVVGGEGDILDITPDTPLPVTMIGGPSGSSDALTDEQLRAAPVPVTGPFYPPTQPVSAAALPLPAGAATETALTALKASVDALSAKIAACNTNSVALDSSTLAALESINAAISGTVVVQNFPATQQVSATSLPLPTGAATESTLAGVSAKMPALESGRIPVVLPAGGGGLTDTQLRAAPVPVDVEFPTTQAVSATALPLPDGAATETTLAAVSAKLPALSGGRIPVELPAGGSGLTDSELRATPVPISAAFVKAEDSPSADGDSGVVILAQRRDTDSAATGTDGDYATLKMDEAGRLKVSTMPASYADITGDITAVQAAIGTPVAGGTVSGDVSRASNVMMFCTGTFAGVNVSFEGSLEATGETNWFGIQAVRSNANTVETATGVLAAQPVYAWELSVNGLARVRVRCTARTSGTQSWRFKLGTYATEPIPAAQISGTQPVSGTVTATEGTPMTPTAIIINSAASTNGTVVKASAGTLYGVALANNGAGDAWFKLHNSTTVTVGTTAVALWIKIPAGSNVNVQWGSKGLRHVTGICCSITGAVGDSDTTAVAAGQVKVNLSYV